jgi:hypothetical protein
MANDCGTIAPASAQTITLPIVGFVRMAVSPYTIIDKAHPGLNVGEILLLNRSFDVDGIFCARTGAVWIAVAHAIRVEFVGYIDIVVLNNCPRKLSWKINRTIQQLNTVIAIVDFVIDNVGVFYLETFVVPILGVEENADLVFL